MVSQMQLTAKLKEAGIAVLMLALALSCLIVAGTGRAHAQGYLILSATGQPLTSIFDNLRPSRPAGPQIHLTAEKTGGCLGLPAKDGIQQKPGATTLQALQSSAPTLQNVSLQQGHYVTVQGPNCGGSYGVCQEQFCTINCTYNNCYAGGDDYCTGWLTNFWDGCCYTSNTCFTQNCD